jgi:hypothetical protein
MLNSLFLLNLHKKQITSDIIKIGINNTLGL